ncbi:MAG: uroporphyrinogen decarboxylase family protein [Candidatus Humimicrobiaceae bacterium]
MNIKDDYFSEFKKRVINAIQHKSVDRLPLMYRAQPETNSKLLKYFGLDPDINESWQELMEIMGFDLFSGGSGIGKFTKFKPSYKGRSKVSLMDGNQFYAWGIDSYFDKNADSINYLVNKSFANLWSIDEMKKYDFPSIGYFDFKYDNTYSYLKSDHFIGAGTLNSIFMIALYLRGPEKLFMELMSEKKLAGYYIDAIGQFVFDYARETLKSAGRELEFYALWDDLAMQSNLMIPHAIFKEFFYPWYKKIFGLAKSYELITYFHVCGNANEIIPDLIDMGVDILDPVQTSARDMQLDKLKKNYGTDICFHGGIDVQELLPLKSPKEITEYLSWVLELFGSGGGLILGPSHSITNDTPLENILSVYRPDL